MWFVLSKQLLQYLLEHSHQLSQMCQMSNIWHIWHIKLQNMSFIRCFICAIFLKHATVHFQIWERTIYLYYNLYYFFILARPTSSVSSSPLSSLCLLIPSPNCIYSLSHFISLLSLSTPHHCLPLWRNPGRSIKPRHTTRTRPTLSYRRPPTQPHKPDPPHPQQPMAWSPCHTTPPSMSCHPPRHRNLPPLDFSQSVCSGGFYFWACLIWDMSLFDLPCRSLWFFFFFFLRWRWWMWVCAGGGCRCCCGSGGCAIVVVDDDNEDDRE